MAKRPLKHLSRSAPTSIRAAAVDMTREEARFLIQDFFTWLKLSMATKEHVRILKKLGLHHDVMDFVCKDAAVLREHIKELMDVWSENFPVAKWAKGIRGVGPVVAGGLAAFVDVDKCKTISSLWRFAGLTPGSRIPPVRYLDTLYAEAEKRFGTEITPRHVEWLAKKLSLKASSLIKLSEHKDGKLTWAGVQMAVRVPKYSATLKRICNAAGNSIVKLSGSVYHDLYLYRKAYEQQRNLSGAYAKQAAEQLRKFDYKRDTRTYKEYTAGRLPPAHLIARAKRWAIKIFLAHYYMVEYYVRYGKEPPDVYALDILHGHRKIHIPNFDQVEYEHTSKA